jgi:hypothetical protein
MKDLAAIFGKEFDSKLTGVGYGVFRKRGAGLPADFSVSRFGTPFAEDSGSNLFTQIQNGSVCFWDHETDDLTVIAKSWEEFASGCIEPKEVKLKPGQVKRVWVDPNFKPKFD